MTSSPSPGKPGIIDENTGRPLYLLLDRARNSGCRIIIADALDDEPYISQQLSRPWR